jgi:hypothetical protein
VQAFLHAKMMLFKMRLCLCKRLASFPPLWNDVVRDALVLLQDGKLACASFPPCWNDVIRDVIALGGNIAHTRFPPH